MVPLCSEKFYLLLFWSRLAHAGLAMHATLAALGALPRSMSLRAPAPVGDMQAVSYGARSRQYSPLLPASTSQPRSIVERPRSGPMGRVHMYTRIQAFRTRPRHAPKHTLPRLARLTLNELQQNQHEKASLVCVRVQSPSGLALVPCALSMVDLSGQLRC